MLLVLIKEVLISFMYKFIIIKDPVIARKCFKLSGSILSNNSITIPDPTADIKNCNLNGRYVWQYYYSRFMFNFLQSLKNYFVFIFKLELKIENLVSDLHLLIWKNNIQLVVEMYILYKFRL